jgi:hypothetical protein
MEDTSKNVACFQNLASLKKEVKTQRGSSSDEKVKGKKK